MGSQYYGFQGPDGLVSVIDNIRNNIVKADMTKISEGSQNIQRNDSGGPTSSATSQE